MTGCVIEHFDFDAAGDLYKKKNNADCEHIYRIGLKLSKLYLIRLKLPSASKENIQLCIDFDHRYI